jgi:hypothetical protein
MLTYLYFGILIAAVAMAIAQIRQSRRNGEPLGADPLDADVALDLSLESSSFLHHDAPEHGGCDAGGRNAGGFDCGHGGFHGGGHHGRGKAHHTPLRLVY